MTHDCITAPILPICISHFVVSSVLEEDDEERTQVSFLYFPNMHVDARNYLVFTVKNIS